MEKAIRKEKLETRRKLVSELAENSDHFSVRKENETVFVRTEPYTEVYAVVSGEAVFTIGQTEYSVSAPAAVVVNAFDIHNFTPAKDADIIGVLIGGDYFSDFKSKEGDSEFISVITDERVSTTICNYASELEKSIDTLDYYEKKAYTNLIVSTLVKNDFIRKIERSTNIRVSAMIRYIYDNSEKPISLKTLAEEFGYVPMTVSHIFSRSIGKDLRRFINEIRIRKAHYEILDKKNKHRSLADISKDCGFNSVATFHRIYKEFYGAPPRENTQDQQQ